MDMYIIILIREKSYGPDFFADTFFFIVFVVAEIAAEAVEGEALEDGDMQEEDESKLGHFI
jgi:hypothetical protein